MTLSTLEPDADPVITPAAEPVIAAAEAAPLAPPAGNQGPSTRLLDQWLNQLLKLLAATPLRSIDDLLAAGRILALAVLAGIALRLTGATLGAIHDIPLLGGLLELVGLVSLLRFLSRHAVRQQKRAELLERIHQLRRQLLG